MARPKFVFMIVIVGWLLGVMLILAPIMSQAYQPDSPLTCRGNEPQINFSDVRGRDPLVIDTPRANLS